MTTNLVVADKSRTEKTICLAVSPSLKSFGIPGRPRLFEVIQKVKEVNALRRGRVKNLSGKSLDFNEIRSNPEVEVDFIVAPPRMAHYIEYSTRIYNIYLKYIAPEDIHVYSIDEVFMDITKYLKVYGGTPRDLAITIIKDVLIETGITATAGIGTNMYLAKVAMDIVAKHTKADKDGVRIAELDEMSYRKALWEHRPITDFWRVGQGYGKKLENAMFYTMGDIARASLTKYGQDKLFKMFGINAEFLIDHAWGYEPCTIEDIRNYKPKAKCMGTGQVLHCPYDFNKARLILKEMTELLSLELVEKRLVTNQLILTVGYDTESLKGTYSGEVTTDMYGRKTPKQAHGSVNLKRYSSSTRNITEKAIELYDKIVDKTLLVRRINISVNNILNESEVANMKEYIQMDFFTDYQKASKFEKEEEKSLEKERKVQEAIIRIKTEFGKNSVLKGMNFEDGATTRERNCQIGGHRE